ncbi:unnamed protein product [Effrenium voratum]|nr:unnamed protein product [Effrenium voratum]
MTFGGESRNYWQRRNERSWKSFCNTSAESERHHQARPQASCQEGRRSTHGRCHQ